MQLFPCINNYSHGPSSNGQQSDERVHNRIARMRDLLTNFRPARPCAAVVHLGRQILGRFREEVGKQPRGSVLDRGHEV
jgi:hypothetical protein